MTISEIEVQLQCAGYSQSEIESMCIIICSSHKHLKISNENLYKVDIFIAGRLSRIRQVTLKGSIYESPWKNPSRHDASGFKRDYQESEENSF